MSLPVGVTTRSSTNLDVLRNRVAGRLANAALRIGTEHYRAFISGSIRYGLEAAVRDFPEPHNGDLAASQDGDDQ